MEDDKILATLAGLLTPKGSSSENASTRASRSKCDEKGNSVCNKTSIFDLSQGERCRVLNLIEELLDAQDDADKLRHTLDEERTEYRERRSVLMKKLDSLGEKHEKALSDIEILKERYTTNLKLLGEKISTVSDRLETTVMEIKELRKTNTELLEENVLLKKLVADNSAALASCQEEKAKLCLQLDVQKEKEKSYKKQLKRAISEVSVDKLKMESAPVEQHDGSALDKNSDSSSRDIVDKNFGAGDFLIDKRPTPNLETITAPAVVIFNKSLQSAFSMVKSDTKIEVNTPVINETQKYSALNYTDNLEDTALLESLFFRF